jgi:hypothetical protein
VPELSRPFAEVFFALPSSPIVHQPISPARTITVTETATAGTASAARFLATGAAYGPHLLVRMTPMAVSASIMVLEGEYIRRR